MVKRADGFFYGQIRVGDAFMLALVFGPRFHDEAFDDTRRIG